MKMRVYQYHAPWSINEHNIHSIGDHVHIFMHIGHTYFPAPILNEVKKAIQITYLILHLISSKGEAKDMLKGAII